MNCPGCYKETGAGFCPRCRRELFDGAPVPPTLSFEAPKAGNLAFFEPHLRRLSLSGVQLKFSLRREQATLLLTEKGGEYILKPVPPTQLYAAIGEAPENEHLTMQIARQVFGMPTAANALIHFADGAPAYLARRFDRRADGSKYLQEDFAQISGKSRSTHGEHYKYEGSYEDVGRLIQRYVAAYMPALEAFFRLVVFNYVISNGDAHLKNFSLYRLETGEYRLTPAYDLMSTVLHTGQESDTALDLYAGDIDSEFYSRHGYYGAPHFLELARRLGMAPQRAKRILSIYPARQPQVKVLVGRSFLSAATQQAYLANFSEKLRRLQRHL
ncbi:HipA domain-containing protein [Paraflavisolibacter sp. H34]|uniref:HipA domain-containing protein n=1 Tax=Huijunlia imazamoxiresistens TaxID=3127457 RepID=UPI00301AADF3